MRYLLTGFLSFFLLTFFYSCQKEVSVEFGLPAKGSLQGDGGDCLPKTVTGTYMAAKAFTDSNFIEVTVDVLSPGPYTIATDTLNGYSFKATGTFSAVGASTVRLKGSGTPVTAGVNNFTVVFDSSFCEIAITVLPAGGNAGPATFTLAGSPNGCTAFDLQGSYVKDTTLKNTNRVGVQVNVTATGTYSIATNTLNGYSFSTTGTFSTTGVQTVFLQGTGKPVAPQTDNFTVTAGTATCTFPVIVLATAASPCGIVPQGTYTAGTALTATNTITLTHNYTTAGPYTVSTGTTNGYSFGPKAITATAGSNTIIVNGTGTPTAAGINTFTVNFGDGTSCILSVTVIAGTPVVNNDYFPTTLNSYWTYDFNGLATDTFQVLNTGPVTFSGVTFQKFVSSEAGVIFNNSYYRKDAATGFYYQSEDTAGYGPELTFTTARVEYQFLKNTLTTNQTWNTDINASYRDSASGITLPVIVRFKYTCLDANATITVNSKTFTGVYKVEEVLQGSIVGSGSFDDLSDPLTYYYVKGVGLVRLTDIVPNSNNIRFWQVF